MKEKLRKIILSVMLSVLSLSASAQGLAYLNPANNIDGRTSFDVFHYHRPKFKHKFEISFKLRLPEEYTIGYIFRVIDDDGKHIYNLYLSSNKGISFSLNREGDRSLVHLIYDAKYNHWGQWVTVRVTFDRDNRSITLQVNNKTAVARNLVPPDQMRPRLIFGRSDYIIDVPPVVIKDLVVSDGGKVKHEFPLSQSNGNGVYDTHSHKMGHVDNPYWSINDNYHWKSIGTATMERDAGAAYLPSLHSVVYFSKDSIKFVDIATGKTEFKHYASPCPLDINLGMNFVRGNRLYAYEVTHDESMDNACSVASLDLKTLKWQDEENGFLPMQRHHHAGFFAGSDSSRYVIYGGFGRERYWNEFYAYDIQGRRWEKLDKIRGPHPARYFISSGSDGRRFVYLFGGMGNSSGEQSVGRRYYYDLYRLDWQKQEMQKLWELTSPNDAKMVPVRSLIVDGQHFYALSYSEFLSKSWMKLYRISLRDGKSVQVGDSIPIISDRIETNANLYFDRALQRFIVTVVEFKDESRSVLHIYTINAPVIDTAAFRETRSNQIDRYLVNELAIGMIIIVLLEAMVFTYLYIRKRHGVAKKPKEEEAEPIKPNSIYLFGEFSAFDREGRDISYMFTDKQRLLLCLLIQYDSRGGISSHTLGNLLWGDKSDDKIKNSRGVAISRLRKTFEEMDGVGVQFDNGRFRLTHADNFYCDYFDVTHQLAAEDNDLRHVVGLLRRGKFLYLIDDPVMDKFKSETEQLVLPYLKRALRKLMESEDYWQAIAVADSIFEIDPINEDAEEQKVKALRRLHRDDDAADAQRRYRKLRQEMMGEE